MFLAHLNKSNDVQTTAATVATVERTEERPAAVIVRPRSAPDPVTTSAVSVVEPVSVRLESVETVRPLRGETRRGDFVHNSQTMGTERGFRNVSDAWLTRGNVQTIDETIERIARERGQMKDVRLTYADFRPAVSDGVFGLENRRNGEFYSLSSEALDQFSERAAIGSTLPRRLLAGDQADAETMAVVAANGLRKLGEKPVLLRTRSADSQIRAFLSEEYAVIDHRWYLEILRAIVPGGLVSHFRSPDGCDSIFFNLLIPDSMRAETDSEYGGMLACGNGETGHSRLRSLPSIFRAICQNGCIWDRVDGISYIMQVHRGEIDLSVLAAQIRDNLNRQIPLLGTGIDAMLQTRAIGTNAADVVPVIGSVLLNLNIPGISRDNAAAIVTAYGDQRTEESKITAFDVIQGITKAAQSFDAFSQETAERAAGAAMLWTPDRWESAFMAAKTIDAKQLKRIFSKTVVS